MTTPQSITRLAELLRQPETPALDVIAAGLAAYCADLVATYGKPSITWRDPIPERLALLLASSMARAPYSSLIDTLLEMSGSQMYPIDYQYECLGDDLRHGAEEIAAAWEAKFEGVE